MDNKGSAEVLKNIDKAYRQFSKEEYKALDTAIKALEQEPCEDWYDVPSDEMTLEQAQQSVRDLRKKLVEHLKQEPCGDAISRSEAIKVASGYCHWTNIPDELAKLPPVTPTPKNVNDVLDEIKADLQILADDEWNQQVMASKGLEFAIEIIENYQMAMMEEVEE